MVFWPMFFHFINMYSTDVLNNYLWSVVQVCSLNIDSKILNDSRFMFTVFCLKSSSVDYMDIWWFEVCLKLH